MELCLQALSPQIIILNLFGKPFNLMNNAWQVIVIKKYQGAKNIKTTAVL